VTPEHLNLRDLVVSAEDSVSEVSRRSYQLIRDSVHPDQAAGFEREITDRCKKIAILLDGIFALLVEVEIEYAKACGESWLLDRMA
jgi:hypothetical protein